MEYRQFQVRHPLSRFVECVWTLRGDAEEAPPETIIPDGCTELIVHLGDRFSWTHGGRTELQPSAFLVGPMLRPLQLAPPHRVSTVGVRFRPAGLRRFVSSPISELTEALTPAAALWGTDGSGLEARLEEGHPDIVSAVEGWLTDRLVGNPAAGPLDGVVDAVLRRRGRVGPGLLERWTGWSDRTVERHFLREIGMPPKTFCRIVRLQGILERVRSEPSDWASIAAECRYFDQSHLIRDFRMLTGTTPARFLAAQGHLSRQFTSPDRLAALLSGFSNPAP